MNTINCSKPDGEHGGLLVVPNGKGAYIIVRRTSAASYPTVTMAVDFARLLAECGSASHDGLVAIEPHRRGDWS